MRFEGNFRPLGRMDVTDLAACIARQTDADWTVERSRQKQFAVHSQTRAIFLLFDHDFRHFEPTWLPKGLELWEINNQRDHAVRNCGAQDRVHLIIDWAEPLSHLELLAYGLDRKEHARKVKMGITPRYD